MAAAAQQSIINFHIAINYSSHRLLRLWIRRRKFGGYCCCRLLLLPLLCGGGRLFQKDLKIHLIHSLCTHHCHHHHYNQYYCEDDTHKKECETAWGKQNIWKWRKKKQKFIKINHLSEICLNFFLRSLWLGLFADSRCAMSDWINWLNHFWARVEEKRMTKLLTILQCLYIYCHMAS